VVVPVGLARAAAEDAHTATITLREHVEPAELHVPAGKRILLTVGNADPLSEEFGSSALKVEKVIAGKSQGVVASVPSMPGPMISSANIARTRRRAGRSLNSAPVPSSPPSLALFARSLAVGVALRQSAKAEPPDGPCVA
jgi:hypothetical protein